MIPFNAIRSELVSGLSAALGLTVTGIHSSDEEPGLPIVTYNFTVVMSGPAGWPIRTADSDAITLTETAEFNVDFQATADSSDEALELALQARDWFVGDGHDILKYGPAATVVVSVGQVANRDVKVDDEWSYQYGFEVKFRTTNKISYDQTTIEHASIREVDPIG